MEQVTRSDLRSPPLSYELGVIDLGKMKAYVCKPRILPPRLDWMLGSDVSDPTDEADSSRWLSLLRLWAGSENRGWEVLHGESGLKASKDPGATTSLNGWETP